MSFAALISKNLFRQRTRTALTVLGITIGIATVVALGAVTGGVKNASAGFVNAGGADFMVAQKGASDLTFSVVSREDVEALSRRPDVAHVSGVLVEVAELPSNPYFLVLGMESRDIEYARLEVFAGRAIRPGAPREAMVGSEAAEDVGARVGGTIVLDRTRFTVVGIYRAGDKFRDAGAIVPLATAQALGGRGDVVTAAHVLVARGARTEDVAAAVEREFPELASIVSVDDYGKVDQGIEIMDAANLAISLLAVGIGAIGVMNTMVMSVFERTREIGILRAVGWRGSRILRMVLLESVLLCLIASVVGVALGVAASRAVLLVPAVSSLLEPAYGPALFARALVIGVLVALAGALYPALRAVRLSPMEALRHE